MHILQYHLFWQFNTTASENRFVLTETGKENNLLPEHTRIAGNVYPANVVWDGQWQWQRLSGIPTSHQQCSKIEYRRKSTIILPKWSRMNSSRKTLFWRQFYTIESQTVLDSSTGHRTRSISIRQSEGYAVDRHFHSFGKRIWDECSSHQSLLQLLSTVAHL